MSMPVCLSRIDAPVDTGEMADTGACGEQVDALAKTLAGGERRPGERCPDGAPTSHLYVPPAISPRTPFR